MNLLDHDAPVEVIQAGLRHRDLSSTWTYLRPMRNVEQLRGYMGHHLKEVS